MTLPADKPALFIGEQGVEQAGVECRDLARSLSLD